MALHHGPPCRSLGLILRVEGIGALAGAEQLGSITRDVDYDPPPAQCVVHVGMAGGVGLGIYFFLEGERAGRQVGGGACGWQIPAVELARVRRLLGLPPLPQHECTCGTCVPFTESGCDGHQISMADRLAARRDRLDATGVTFYGHPIRR